MNERRRRIRQTFSEPVFAYKHLKDTTPTIVKKVIGKVVDSVVQTEFGPAGKAVADGVIWSIDKLDTLFIDRHRGDYEEYLQRINSNRAVNNRSTLNGISRTLEDGVRYKSKDGYNQYAIPDIAIDDIFKPKDTFTTRKSRNIRTTKPGSVQTDFHIVSSLFKKPKTSNMIAKRPKHSDTGKIFLKQRMNKSKEVEPNIRQFVYDIPVPIMNSEILGEEQNISLAPHTNVGDNFYKDGLKLTKYIGHERNAKGNVQPYIQLSAGNYPILCDVTDSTISVVENGANQIGHRPPTEESVYNSSLLQ